MARASVVDIVVVDSIAAGYAAPALPSTEAPVVGMLHQGPGGIGHGAVRRRLQAWLDRRAYARMRALLVASESLADRMRAVNRDIRVVPPGRDPAPTADPKVMDLRRGRDVAFLCVGNWVPPKGIVELLDAFASVPAPLARLHLVGDEAVEPAYARRVRGRIERLGDRVIAHGPVSRARVDALYRAADAFVLPSLREPYGTVYGEAMAAGLPVVGWRAGNLPHLIGGGREGLMVEPGDVPGLTESMVRIASDDGLRSAMAEAAFKRGALLPTWERTAETFFATLRGVLAHEGR
jgi:glycosyltransferase involved in cell wall biosynthesis